MAIETKHIVSALTKVMDPNTGQDVITMNMVRDLDVQGQQVNFTLELPSLSSEYKQELNFACIAAIQEVYPGADVNVHMMAKAGQAASPKPNNPFSHIKNIIAVASGKGGVGKSTVAVNLALGLKELGATVGLIDADLYGPSIPTMLNLQGQRPKVQSVYDKPKILPLEAYGIQVMSIGFIIEPEQAVVLRGPRLGAIIKQFFQDTIWPPLDYMIVDLPPGTGDVQLSLVQTVPVTGAVMVTTPQEVAVVDAVKAVNMFGLPSVNVPILGVVENMSWFTPEELPNNKYYLFGQGGGEKLVKQSNSAFLGQIPIVQGIREAGDAGKPIVLDKDKAITRKAFLEVAQNTAEQTRIRNEKLAPSRKVDVQ
ncbi:MAG TPA: Mrp/NBP35 family ATP-binding protein [Saprospiraceae bacterium]|nr:Mrp/NBP35 family ATP-binding protein [Saprospiraceae bacterium]